MFLPLSFSSFYVPFFLLTRAGSETTKAKRKSIVDFAVVVVVVDYFAVVFVDAYALDILRLFAFKSLRGRRVKNQSVIVG